MVRPSRRQYELSFIDGEKTKVLKARNIPLTIEKKLKTTQDQSPTEHKIR